MFLWSVVKIFFCCCYACSFYKIGFKTEELSWMSENVERTIEKSLTENECNISRKVVSCEVQIVECINFTFKNIQIVILVNSQSSDSNSADPCSDMHPQHNIFVWYLLFLKHDILEATFSVVTKQNSFHYNNRMKKYFYLGRRSIKIIYFIHMLPTKNKTFSYLLVSLGVFPVTIINLPPSQ